MSDPAMAQYDVTVAFNCKFTVRELPGALKGAKNKTFHDGKIFFSF